MLQYCVNPINQFLGIDTWTDFYIPYFDEPPNCLSGMVIALFGEFPEPGFAYISKEEDTDKVHELLKESIDWKNSKAIGPISDEDTVEVHELLKKSIDWKNYYTIGPVSDWHSPQFLELCEKYAKIKFEVTVSQWELPSLKERPKLEKISNFKSKSGQELIVKQLNGPEHSQIIFESWKFRRDHSIHWIRSQCKSGLAYGVFRTSEESTGVFIW